jgi:hypothetical protein
VTPDAACLSLPNPCAVCGPNMAQVLPALGDYPQGGYFREGAPGNGNATVTLMEPGKRPEQIPLPQEESFPLVMHPVQPGFLGSPRQFGMEPDYMQDPYMGAYGERQGSHDYQQHRLDSYQGEMYHHSPGDYAATGGAFSPARQSFRDGYGVGGYGGLGGPSAHDVGGYGGLGGLGGQSAHDFQAMEEQELMRLRLQEKREQLDASLLRYSQVGQQLKYSPENELLRQSHEEAEIEAAGLQAEVAVLSQKLNDFDEAARVGATPVA